eukprot:2734063-Alexandrium_andersonii.AAC.1
MSIRGHLGTRATFVQEGVALGVFPHFGPPSPLPPGALARITPMDAEDIRTEVSVGANGSTTMMQYAPNA